MRHFKVISVLFFLLALPSGFCQRVAESTLLENAREQADLFGGQAPPFVLEADFMIQVNVPVQGHLQIHWGGKNSWRMEVTTPIYQETEVRDGEMDYAVRSIPFEPLRMQQLIDLLHFVNHARDVDVEKVKQTKDDGIAEMCFRVHLKQYQNSKRVICVDMASGSIRREQHVILVDTKETTEFRNSIGIGKLQFPGKLVLIQNGSRIVDITVTKLEAAPFESAFLTPPANAIMRRKCDGLKHAVPITMPPPTPPEGTHGIQSGGDTTVEMTILTDGSVGAVYLLAKSTHILDEAVIQAAKQWRFKPAMCGDTPVVSDEQFTLSVRVSKY